MSPMLNQLASQLYRGRPLTKTIPFAVTAITVDPIPLWRPENAYFEVQRIYIRCTVPGIDVNFVDSAVDNVFAFSMPDNLSYLPGMVDFAPSTYRSINLASNYLGLVDPSASGAVFKGFIEGWEVTREGSYR